MALVTWVFNFLLVLGLSVQTSSYVLFRRVSMAIYREQYSVHALLCVQEVVKLIISVCLICVDIHNRRKSRGEEDHHSTTLVEDEEEPHTIGRTGSHDELEDGRPVSKRSSSSNKAAVEVLDDLTLIRRIQVLVSGGRVMFCVAGIYLIMNVFTFLAVRVIDSTTCILMFQLKLASTTIASWLILKKTYSRVKVIAIMFIITGVVQVAYSTSPSGTERHEILDKLYAGEAKIVDVADPVELNSVTHAPMARAVISPGTDATTRAAPARGLGVASSDLQSYDDYYQMAISFLNGDISLKSKGRRLEPPTIGTRQEVSQSAEFYWMLGILAMLVEVSLSALANVYLETQFKKTQNSRKPTSTDTNQRAAYQSASQDAEVPVVQPERSSDATIAEDVKRFQTQCSLWDRNFQLALASCIMYFFLDICDRWRLSTMANTTYEANKIMYQSFFHGWSIITCILLCLGVIGGFLVALTIKYTDAVIKCMATSASIVITTIVSWLCMDGIMSMELFLGCSLVILAVYQYQLN